MVTSPGTNDVRHVPRQLVSAYVRPVYRTHVNARFTTAKAAEFSAWASRTLGRPIRRNLACEATKAALGCRLAGERVTLGKLSGAAGQAPATSAPQLACSAIRRLALPILCSTRR